MNVKHKTSILMLEDNAGDVELVRIFLEEAGWKFELHHRESLLDGLEFLERQPVELVLLDLHLSDSSGFKTIAAFLEKAAGTPVVVVSGTDNEVISQQAVKAGAQDVLVKGQFDSKLLAKTARFAMQRAKSQTKLQATARDLETFKRRFLEAQELACFGSWEMDLVTNEMKWTDEAYRIFGCQPGSFSPTLSDYLGCAYFEDRAAVEDFFENAAKDGKRRQFEHRVLRDGSAVRHVAVHAKVQFEEQGGKILLVGGVQDITERKLSEKLLLEKNISSKTARMQEEVLAELGFQIRTPLSSIVNLLFLMEKTQLGNQQGAFVRDLKTSVDDLSLAVSDLLNFSVMVSDSVKVEEEEFNLREFLQSVGKVLKIKADREKLSLDLEVDEELPEKITGDPKKLAQILYNLLDNAIRHTPQGGKITLAAALAPPPSELAPRTRGGWGAAEAGKIGLLLTVRDTGAGMPKSKIAALLEADRLLDEAPQKEEPGKKRPLGVAIAVKLLKTLGGSLDIQSREGEGSAFTLNLPVKPARQAKFRIGRAPEAPLKILLVEDHFLNQLATKKVLTSWSDLVTVDIAENGAVAVEKFRESGCDLILMDLQMPVMDGLEAARHIRRMSAEVPIIALSANSTKQEQDKCLETGMNDYLAKPFKPQELYARIAHLMALVLN